MPTSLSDGSQMEFLRSTGENSASTRKFLRKDNSHLFRHFEVFGMHNLAGFKASQTFGEGQRSSSEQLRAGIGHANLERLGVTGSRVDG